jgi:hypothetical protein
MSSNRSIGRYVSLGIGTLLLLVVGSQLIMIWRSNARLSGKLAELRTAGEPTTATDLTPAPIAAESNAAAQLSKIGQALDAFENKSYGPFEQSKLGKKWQLGQAKGDAPTAEQLAEIQAILAKYPEILPAFQKAVKCPSYATLFNFNQPSMIAAPMPEVHRHRLLANFVSLQMQVLSAAGKGDEAMRLGIDLLRLSRHTDGEPFLVAYLVSLAIREIACTSINDILQRGKIDVKVSEQLEAELARHDVIANLAAAFRSDRVAGLSALNEQVGGAIGFLVWPMTNWKVGYLDLYSAAMDLTKLQWFESQTAMAKAQQAAAAGGPMASLLVPSLDLTYKAANRVAARLRCLRLLNARQAYAQQNGRDAAGLDDLSLPKAATIDPFSGQPLKLKHTDKGWIIYTIMDNGVDDGGDFTDRKDYGVAPPGHDFDPSEFEEFVDDDQKEDTNQKSEVP